MAKFGTRPIKNGLPHAQPKWTALTQQNAEVNSVAISGDGKTVIAGTYYHGGTKPSQLGTYVYDETGKSLGLDPLAVKTNYGVYWVAISRDSKWAASAGGVHVYPPLNGNSPGFVYAYDLSQPKLTRIPLIDQPGSGAPISGATMGGANIVALSGNGMYLAAGADAAYLFSRKNGPFALARKYAVENNQSVPAVAISNDGGLIVYGTSTGGTGSGEVVLCVNDEVAVLQSPQVAGQQGPPVPFPIQQVHWQAPLNQDIESVAMAADGSGFAAVASNRLYHKKKNDGVQPVCTLYFFSMKKGANYFPQTSNFAKSLQLFDGNNVACLSALSIAITDDGTRAAVAANNTNDLSGTLFYIDTASATVLWQQATTHALNSTSMDGNGQYVAAADGYKPIPPPGDFYLYDAQGNQLVSFPLEGTLPVFWSTQISSDASAIAVGNDNGSVYYFPGPGI